MVIPLIARCAATVAVASGITLGSVHAKQLTICGEKVDYDSSSASAQTPSPGRDLAGIWVGELLAQNFAYSVDYMRCVAFAIEGVQANGKVTAKYVAGASAKNMTQGTSYGSKPLVTRWDGQLNGNTLRFESDDKKTAYEFQFSGSAKIQGTYSSPLARGRVWLTKQ